MEGEATEVIFVPNEEKIEANEEPKIDDPDRIEHSSKRPTTAPTTVRLTVGVPIWKYLAKSKKFSDAINSIVSQYEIVCELDPDAVVLKGQIENRLILAKRQLEELIEECQVDVLSFIIPRLEPDVYSKVMSYLEGQDEITWNLYSKTNQICLTGQKKQIDDCLGVLQEIYGVTGALPFLNDETSGMSGSHDSVSVVKHHIGQDPDCTENFVNKVAETDDHVCSHDQFDDELYGTNASSVEIDDDALIMNEKIWMYIEKCYCEDIKQIKENLGLGGAIETSALTEQCDHRIRIAFSGPDEALIRNSMLEMKSVIERCQGAGIKTLKVPCPDVAVHQRITKLLKPINRLPSYVSMGPELISITGTKEEIDVCLEKLKTYGLQYKDLAAPVESFPQPANEISVVDKITKDFDSDDDQQYEHYRQLPTPVEESVWFYIENRCRQQLNDLKKGYNLQIIPDQAGAPGLVNITLASHSTDMLDCGQDALIALIMQLRQQIVLGVMNTASLEDLPFELQGMLQEQFHNMDSLVVVKGNKITTIGPNHEAMKSQQIVSAFMQNIVADARRMGYDTSKFDPAMMPTGGFRSDDLRAPGDFIGFNHQENCRDAIDQKDKHSGTSTHLSEALNGDHMGSDQRVQVSGSSHLKTREEKPLLESNSDKTVAVPDISSGYAETQKKHESVQHENAIKGFESNQSCVVSDNLSSHMEDSRTNGSNKVVNGTQCNAAKANVHVCSSCYHDLSSSSSRDDQSCGHVYCASCICQHFGEWKCPVCDIENSAKNQIVSQPENGNMLVTYDNSFKLPGFENNSRGTIIITYAFPSGIQSDELPNPGQFYPSFTATAFLPMCRVGSKVVDLLQRAFEKRLVLKISQSNDESNGKLVWNGLHHKVNIYKTIKQDGYPDPDYLQRICRELAAKGIREE